MPPSSKVAAVKDKGRTTVIQRGLDLKQVVVAKFLSMGCRSAIKDNASVSVVFIFGSCSSAGL